MKLRRKLIYLLATFSLFVVAATSFTIYSIQLLLEDTVTSFYDWMAQSSEVANLRIATGEHIRSLTEIVEGRRPLTETYRQSHDRFLTTLEQAAGATGSLPARATTEDTGGQAASGTQTLNEPAPSRSRLGKATDPRWRVIARLADELHDASTECLNLVDSGRVDEAGALLKGRISGDLADKLDARLRELQPALEAGRSESVRQLVATKTTVLMLATALSVFAGALVLGGGILIGRWLIAPIADLQRVADEFRRGNLEHRAAPRFNDELGQLGLTLNTMAQSLSGARKELRTSEAKYRALFQNLRDAVVICDDQGVIVECHDGDTHLLNINRDEPVGRHLLDAWPEWRTGTTDWDSLIKQVAGRVHLDAPQSGHQDGPRLVHHDAPYRAEDVELTRQADDQGRQTVDLVVYPVAYADARYVAILLRDARERRRLQRRIRQAEKMETAGTLAGGVAHDFNNLLTSAIGALSLIEAEGQGEKTPGRIKTALRACWQAAGLSRRLLRFAHSGHHRPQVLRLSEMVELILSAQDETFVQGIELSTELDAEVLVRIDKDELTQVILNLLRNAKDAMADAGALRIRVDSTVPPPDGERDAHAPLARLTIEDTGAGMPADVRQRMFEPFFTTKSRTSRRGTGMGMAVAYSVIRGAGGFIDVDSEVGVGTTVSVYLPLADGTPESLETPWRRLPAGGITGESPMPHVLLVDDDPMVLHTCTDVLETLGCTVLTAQSVEEGRRRFQEAVWQRLPADGITGDSPGPHISLAIIDLALTDGSGFDLAKALVSVDPRIRLVLMSGFGDTTVPKEIEGQVLAVLSKPFRLDELAATLSVATSPAPPHS